MEDEWEWSVAIGGSSAARVNTVLTGGLRVETSDIYGATHRAFLAATAALQV